MTENVKSKIIIFCHKIRLATAFELYLKNSYFWRVENLK